MFATLSEPRRPRSCSSPAAPPASAPPWSRAFAAQRRARGLRRHRCGERRRPGRAAGWRGARAAVHPMRPARHRGLAGGDRRACGGSSGPIAVLVNNAANDERQTVDDVTPEYWDRAMAVNLRHQFFAAQAVRPHMRELGGGSIINFSSIAWMGGGAEHGGLHQRQGGDRRHDPQPRPRVRRATTSASTPIAPGAVITERQRRLWLSRKPTVAAWSSRQCIRTGICGRTISPAPRCSSPPTTAAMITKQCLMVDARAALTNVSLCR